MAFCSNCGSAIGDGSSFCGSCGRPVNSSPAPGSQVVAMSNQPASGTTGLTSNVAGALAYILGLISGIVFLVLEPYKNDRFVRFHAMQSILYSAACVVFAILWGILWAIVGSISGYLFMIAIPIRLLISLAMFLFWLFLIYQAYSQREYRIPIIGEIAAKQAGTWR